jgi:hypothetical protein
MNVDEVEPRLETGALLAGAQFSDAFRVAVDGNTLDARTAAKIMFTRGPRWSKALIALRNMIVAPIGLKTSGKGDAGPRGMIGIFSIVSETPERLVAGFNDSHLDFRVIVDVTPAGHRQHVTVTTLVLTHNRVGRAYLAIILPFHRLIVRSFLRRVSRAGAA